jgi:hypothetical protein
MALVEMIRQVTSDESMRIGSSAGGSATPWRLPISASSRPD